MGKKLLQRYKQKCGYGLKDGEMKKKRRGEREQREGGMMVQEWW